MQDKDNIPIVNKLRFNRQSVANDETLVNTVNELMKGNPQTFGVMCDPDLNLVLVVRAQDAKDPVRRMVFNYITKKRNGEEFLVPVGKFPESLLAKARFEAGNLKAWQEAGVVLDQLPYLVTEQ